MSWFSTTVVAVITAAIGCLLSGYVACQEVRLAFIEYLEKEFGGKRETGKYFGAFAK